MLSFDFINFSGIINHASPKTYTEGGGKMAVQKENNRLNGELIDEETILTNSLMGEIHSLEDCLTKKRQELANNLREKNAHNNELIEETEFTEKERQLIGEIKKLSQQISTKYLLIATHETNIYEYQRLLATASEYSRMAETKSGC